MIYGGYKARRLEGSALCCSLGSVGSPIGGISSSPRIVANATGASPANVADVLLRVLVPLRAVSNHVSPQPAFDIGLMADRFQVVDIDARRGAAEMIENHSIGNHALCQHVSKTVRCDHPTLPTESSVPLTVEMSFPYEASFGALHIFPEALSAQLDRVFALGSKFKFACPASRDVISRSGVRTLIEHLKPILSGVTGAGSYELPRPTILLSVAP